eukprot:gnl/Trimastix_PCT/1024.p1 GENE.gnl/Trimastix_PCT/1024~~gnl/Trimastix_PCT/1024.p1  ORF type:complete len:691 (-),score=56.82 gnl/Trimastix_PCT/1024:1028-3100(-)
MQQTTNYQLCLARIATLHPHWPGSKVQEHAISRKDAFLSAGGHLSRREKIKMQREFWQTLLQELFFEEPDKPGPTLDRFFSRNSRIQRRMLEPGPPSEPDCLSLIAQYDDTPEPTRSIPQKRKTPAQDKVVEQIKRQKESIANLIEDQKRAHTADTHNMLQLALVRARKELKDSEKSLKRKQQVCAAQQKLRENQRREKAEEQGFRLRCPGRPPFEELNQDLRDEIYAVLTQHDTFASLKRRGEFDRTIHSVKQLHRSLLAKGISLSYSATFLYLMPVNKRRRESKRHRPNPLPFKLVKPHDAAREEHQDQHYCASMVKKAMLAAHTHLPESILISQDDKAKVPLGTAAIGRQTSIVMGMERDVDMPDHTFPVAAKHKLTPSCYLVMQMNNSEELSRFGPLHAFIRSAKHEGTSAHSHAEDLHALCTDTNLPCAPLLRTPDGSYRPNMFVITDGGPDENVRFIGTQLAWTQVFREMDLDYLCVCHYAPGCSAFNPVERAMAPLSKYLSGVILPYDLNGSHLSGNGETRDENLERENFEAAGMMLAEIWHGQELFGYSVQAKYVDPTTPYHFPFVLSPKPSDPISDNEKFYHAHARCTRYSFQLRKCNDVHCCGPKRGTLIQKLEFNDGFIPNPKPDDLREGHFRTLAADLNLKEADHHPDGFCLISHPEHSDNTFSSSSNSSTKLRFALL